MALPRRARAVLPVAIGGLLLGVAQLHGDLHHLLPVVPLLLLVLSLLLGHYPGSEAAFRLSRRIAARHRRERRAGLRQRRPPLPTSQAAGGGLLLALSLSGRAPPA